MCGIFFILSKSGVFSKQTIDLIISKFSLLSPRGPDKYSLTYIDNYILGFQRLAINDTSDNGMQPFHFTNNKSNTYTMCNGEIYNYKELMKEYNTFNPLSKSDCEILPYLFSIYSFDYAINKLDGVFAISHLDLVENKLYIGRDRLGVKPLFYAENNSFFGIASEAKALTDIFDDIQQLQPSSYMTYCLKTYEKTYNVYTSINEITDCIDSYEESVKIIHDLLVNAVNKRMCSDREIGCLLSGGLDSSVISSILSKELKKKGQKLHTFSIGFPDSTDIVYARQVASYIDSEHHEFIIQYDDALKELENVIKATETFDTTTVRASTPMYMLCKWINENFPHKVIFSGEGADELFCGYLYFHKSPSARESHIDSLRLLRELYKYDVLRADRCTASNGLEFREPFLDKNLIDYVTSIDPSYKIPRNGYEKELLRKAFSENCHLEDKRYLPDSVLWRRKAAFSDAVSSSSKPWYKWIQEYVLNERVIDYGGTMESNYFKSLFYKNFSGYNPDIPLWLPRWSNVGNEPSATVLDVYKKEEH
jgi:asparagine synthase (glutamine-hydrolysing)